MPGAGVRARVCARPRRSARAGGGGGDGGVRTRGTPPPAPRVPPPPSLPPQFAPRLGFERSGAGSGSPAEPAGRPAARTACGRAGDAGPPRARPSPGPGPRGKGLSRPPPPGWRASPRSPSACSSGCSCRRCPAPGHRAPQVSAPAGLPAASPGRPGTRRGAPGGGSCAGSRGRGARGRSPGPCLQTPAAESRRARATAPGPGVPRQPACGELLRFTFPPGPRAGVTLRGCCEYFHLLPPTCRNLSLECLGRRVGKRHRRPRGGERSLPSSFLGSARFSRGGLVANWPRLPGRWLFFSPGGHRKLQTCPQHAASLSLPLSRPLVLKKAPVGVFALTTETAVPPPYPMLFIRSKWAPL